MTCGSGVIFPDSLHSQDSNVFITPTVCTQLAWCYSRDKASCTPLGFSRLKYFANPQISAGFLGVGGADLSDKRGAAGTSCEADLEMEGSVSCSEGSWWRTGRSFLSVMFYLQNTQCHDLPPAAKLADPARSFAEPGEELGAGGCSWASSFALGLSKDTSLVQKLNETSFPASHQQDSCWRLPYTLLMGVSCTPEPGLDFHQADDFPVLTAGLHLKSPPNSSCQHQWQVHLKLVKIIVLIPKVKKNQLRKCWDRRFWHERSMICQTLLAGF